MYPPKHLLIPILTFAGLCLAGSNAYPQSRDFIQKRAERSASQLQEFDRSRGESSIGPVRAPARRATGLPDYSAPSNSEFRTDKIHPVTDLQSGKTYKYPTILALENGDLLVAYMEHGWHYATLWVTRSTDGGTTWNPPQEIATGDRLSFYFLRLTSTSSGRILLADESPRSDNHLFYSDDSGLTWNAAEIDDIVQPRKEDWPAVWVSANHKDTWCGTPNGPEGEDAASNNTEPIVGPVGDDVWHVYSDLSDGTVKYFVSQDGLTWSDEPQTMLVNPDASRSFLYLHDVVPTGVDSFLASFKKLHTDRDGCDASTVLSRSVDGGLTWSTPQPLDLGMPSDLGRLKKAPDGTLWFVFQDSLFNWGLGGLWLPPSDIYYVTSQDDGISWSAPERFTSFVGTDIQPDLAFGANGPMVAFASTRFLPGEFSTMALAGYYPDHGQIWIGSPGDGGEYVGSMPPVVEFEHPFRFTVSSHEVVEIRATVIDEGDVGRVWFAYGSPDQGFTEVDLDPNGDDDTWSGQIGPLPLGEVVDFALWAEDSDGNRSYSDRVPENLWTPHNDLFPARLYVLARHDVGNVCADMTSAVSPDPDDYLSWFFGFLPRSAGIGPWPINLPRRPGTASMLWPCPGGDHYLFEADFFLGIKTINEEADPTSIIQWDVTWTEVVPPVEYQGPSDQDYQLKYTDSKGLGAQVTQRSHQFSSGDAADMIFFEYTVENRGDAGDFGDLIAALYFDPEIGFSGDDYLAFDNRDNVLYAYDSGRLCEERGIVNCPDGVIALMLLSEQEVKLVSSRHWYDYLTVTDLWDDGLSPDLVAGDPVGDFDATGALGVGIESLEVGQTETVVFAMIMAENPSELLEIKVPLAREVHSELLCPELATCSAIESLEIPPRYELHTNYPNPFNPSTTIRFDVPVPGEVTLTIFDLLGRQVENLAKGMHTAGTHAYLWDASEVAAGVYIYRLEADDYVASKSLVLLK